MIDAMQILKLLYFFLPAYTANMAPVLGRWFLKPLAIPIDAKRTINGKRILGDHKTWRGLLLGITTGTCIAYLQAISTPTDWLLIDQSKWLATGILLSTGALFGDMAKSFIKRRIGVKPGARWVPFDQLDFVIGALLFISPIYFPGWLESITLAAITFILYIIINESAYRTGIRDSRW